MDAWLKSVLRAVLVAALDGAGTLVGRLPWFLERMVAPLVDEAKKNVDVMVDWIILRVLQELGSLPPAEFGALPPDLQAAAKAVGSPRP